MFDGAPRDAWRAVGARLPRVDGYWLRQLAYWGSRYGPEPLIRYSPTFWGGVLGLALRRQRSIVRRNLRRIHGQRPRLVEEADALRTFVRYAHCLAESLGVDRTPHPLAEPQLRGEQHLLDALALGRGVVVVTAHTGLWDVAARVLSQKLAGEVVIVMQREADERARQLHDRLRQRDGVRIWHLDHPLEGIDLLHHLRRGGAVAIQIDRVPPGVRSVRVNLFDTSSDMPEGPFLLASASGAPLVPVFAHRTGYFEYEMACSPMLRLPRRADKMAIQRAADTVANELARFVRAHPNDWFHFEERLT